jgi:sigma54-dependent transcription regulator
MSRRSWLRRSRTSSDDWRRRVRERPNSAGTTATRRTTDWIVLATVKEGAMSKAERVTRIELVERLEMEMFTGMPDDLPRKYAPDTPNDSFKRLQLFQLVELCREALGDG